MGAVNTSSAEGLGWTVCSAFNQFCPCPVGGWSSQTELVGAGRALVVIRIRGNIQTYGDLTRQKHFSLLPFLAFTERGLDSPMLSVVSSVVSFRFSPSESRERVPRPRNLRSIESQWVCICHL